MFRILDFVIFALFLLLSILVGVYHGVQSKRKQHSHGKTAEFLTGGRKLPIIPVCLSLLTTFISGIALLGLPAEIYQKGMIVGVSFVTATFSFILTGIFFVPVFYKLQFISVYEYFYMRFGSRLLQRIGSTLFLISTLFYMAVVMYAPSVALVGVTDLPLWPFILVVGVVSTVYTTIGGIKAVIWTDTLQAAFMYIGLGTLLIKGTLDAGGLGHVFEVAEDTGRFSRSMAKWNVSPLQYNSLWISLIGGTLHFTCFYGLNQMALQRYCSMPSLRSARIVMAFTVPAFLIIGSMCCYIGLLMLAYFNGCDPLHKDRQEIDSPDQLSILMASRVLEIVPGLPGLFLSTLFSSTLSTTSSGMNSMTAVLWEDFFKHTMDKNKNDEKRAAKIMKISTLVIGVVATALAFACDYMGGIFNASLSTLGATAGPLVGLFFLGILVPRANKNGAFAGLATASLVVLCCTVAYNIEKPYEKYALPLESNLTASKACIDYPLNSPKHDQVHISILKHHTLDQSNNYTAVTYDMHYGNPDTTAFSRVSPYIYAALGVAIVVAVGAPVSYLFPDRLQTVKEKKAAYACTYAGLNVDIDWKTFAKNECHPTTDRLLEELKTDMGMAHPSY
ncbi:hypothetical protein QR680_017782 [Steinernema hermaphroditum]|uniref:Sodium-coupled monocarboxylate transporter 1 n=1 Tax=Steinernema hermaphroditum TaxID=289476 RepID=A0AA39LPQ7_9BILA|nr:hypothetical protein QR680_017782 [Steinernema hermaphroditum]